MSFEKGFERAMTGNRLNIHTDIKGWERAWIEDLDMQMHAYATSAHIHSLTSVPGHSVADLAQLNNDSSILNIENQARFTCRLQERVARVVCRSIAEESFEAEWRGAKPERREECIYKALFNTFKDTDMELRRSYCPETTLKFMSAENGEAYLRLLRVLMPAAAGITDPIRVPNTILDRLASPTPKEAKLPGIKTYYRDFHISRSLVITTVVYDVYLAFYGLQQEHPTARPSRNKHKTEKTDSQYQRDHMKRATDYYKQMRRTQPNVCWNCSQPAEKLLACSKCRPIGRKIAYCSRECQIDDWKNGIPQAHKLICGKAMTEDELATLAPPTPRIDAEDESWLPQPDRSVKPSPALLHQLAELRETKVFDYNVIDPTVSYNVGIRFSFDAAEKLLFVVHRNRAIRTGNFDSVRAMYTICTQFSHVFKLTPEGFRKQLELEYGVSIPAEPIHLFSIWPPPNAQEAQEANKSIDTQKLFLKQLPEEPATQPGQLGVD